MISGVDQGDMVRPRRRLRILSTEKHLSSGLSWLLLSPVLLIYAIIFVFPISVIVFQSVFDPVFTLDNYRMIVSESLFLKVVWRTVWISFIVAVVCLFLGYPVAALMAKVRGKWAAAAIAASVLIPLWLSVLVRSYAWVVLLSKNGLITSALRDVGLISKSTRIIFTDFSVVLAMSHVLLPFMILPLYASLSSISDDYAKAAESLGARPTMTFFAVTLPLSAPGIYSGLVLVFVVSLGFFVTPQLVGGPNSMLAAMLISREATYGNNWGLASALSVTLFIAAILVVALFGRLANFSQPKQEKAQ